MNNFFGIERKENETDWEFCFRCIRAKINKDVDVDYQDIIDYFDLKLNHDSLRKAVNVSDFSAIKVAEYYENKIEEMKVKSNCDSNNDNIDDLLLELEIKKSELFRERVKLQDYRASIRREDRIIARWEHVYDLLANEIKSLPQVKIELATNDKGNAEASVLISDVHIGKGVNTPHNQYNLEIAKYRLEKLATKVIHFCELHKVGTLNIDFLGDLVENNIHLTSQVEQACDLASQIAYASEYLSQFISTVAPHFNNIRLHSVSGNHDRMENNAKLARMNVENYVKLIDKTIELRTGLKFERSNIDSEIEIYKLNNNGKVIALQHGHNVKNIDTLVKDVSFYLDTDVDYCHIGHYHNFKTVKGTIVNGSVCGSCDYANKLRYNDKASQVLAVYYEDGSQVLHNIVLN